MKFPKLGSLIRRRGWLVAAAATVMVVAMVPVGTAQAKSTPINLGQIDFWGMAVYDVSDVTDQLNQAAGYNFSPASSATYNNVVLPHESPVRQNITLESQWSLDDGPFAQVVHASANVGPWKASTTKSTQFAGYGVEDVATVQKQLSDSGMKLIALKPNVFAYYQGINGNVIEILDQDLVPTPQDNGAPPDGVFYLGDRYAHFDYSPCGQIDAMADQLSIALGTTFDFAPLPSDPAIFNFYDANNQYTDSQQFIIRIRDQHEAEPRVDLDQGLPLPGESVRPPFTCDSIHIAYVMPTSLLPGPPPPGNTAELDAQMLAAGLNRFSDVNYLGARVLGFYVGKGGIVLETTDALVDVL